MEEDKSIFERLARVGSYENAGPATSRRNSPIRSSSSCTNVEELNHDPEKGPEPTGEIASNENEKDSNVIDWDGDDDPEKPVNWTKKKKWFNILMIASITLLTPFGSSMFAPGVPEMMKEFNSDSIDLASFVVSVYVLGYAFGPLIIAPMSELYGRVPVYHTNTFLFLCFNIACARATSLNMEIGFRFLAGLFGSCPVTIGSGTIADMFRQEERGWVMSAWTLPILLGPTLGPVVGGYLSAAAGWRWNFYLLTIWTAVMLVITGIFMNETYPPVLLERKVKRLRKERNNPDLQPARKSNLSPRRLLLLNIIRPTKLLLLSPIVFILSLYIAVVYGYLYIMFSTMTTVFETQYGISSANVGLTFLGLGAGQFLGLLLFGSISDKMVKKAAKANGGEMKPEFRLPLLLWTSMVCPIGLIIYGWTAQYKIHWIVPIIGTSMVSFGLICVFMPVGTYLVDAFTTYAASAMAANTVLRSLGGALLPLAGRRLYDKIGLGWGNSLLAFVAMAFIPLVFFLMKYAERIRTHPKFQIKL